METFTKKYKSDGTYNAPKKGSREGLQIYSADTITEWANDDLCIDRQRCATELERRTQVKAERLAYDEGRRLELEEREAAAERRLADKRDLLNSNPFDPRTEISADARHIAGRVVSTLWIIFVLIPFVLGILFEILK